MVVSRGKKIKIIVKRKWCIKSRLVKTVIFIVNLTISTCSAQVLKCSHFSQRCSGKGNVLVVEFEQHEFTFHQAFVIELYISALRQFREAL